MSPLTIRISITLCIILVLTNPSTSLAPRPQRNDASIADAIRYLNELDSVYSKASKSRFGKRNNNIPIKIYNPENHLNDEEEDWPEYPYIRR